MTKLKYLLFFLLIAFMCCLSLPKAAQALGEPSDTLPNNGSRQPPDSPQLPWLVVSTGDMKAPKTFVFIYVPSTTASFNVNIIDGCSTPLDTYDGGLSTGRTQYMVSTTNSSGSGTGVIYNSPSANSNCNGNMTLNNVVASSTHQITVNAITYNVYRFDAVASTSLSTFYENQFRVNVTGGLVGFGSLREVYTGTPPPAFYYSSIYSWRDSSSTTDVAGDTQKWQTTIGFSPYCSFGTGNADVEIYDIDSSEFQSGSPMHLKLVGINKSTGAVTTVADTDLTGTNTGNNQVLTLTYSFSSSNRYELTFSNVSRRNSVQFLLPFNQIGYADNCGPTPSVSCSVASANLEAPASYTPSVTVNYTAGAGYPGASVNTTVTTNGAAQTVNGTAIAAGGSPNSATVNTFSPPVTLSAGSYTASASVSGSAGSTTLSANCSGTVTVIAKPYFKAFSGSTRVGAGFNSGSTACTVPATVGRVQAFAVNSGGLRGASTSQDLTALRQVYDSFYSSSVNPGGTPTFRALTFANNDNAQQFGGNFGGTQCITDYATTTKKSGIPTDSTSSMSINNLDASAGASNQVQWGPVNGGGSYTLTGGGFAAGNKVTVYVDGNVHITGNITLNQNYTSLADIPFFALIVRGNITVAPGVTTLDGIYVAQPLTGVANSGGIYTCAPSSASLYPANQLYANCNSKLTFNGSVIAKVIKLQRTLGTLSLATLNEGQTNNIAEVFKAVPEFYLVNPDWNTGASSAQLYDSATSLPPIL